MHVPRTTGVMMVFLMKAIEVWVDIIETPIPSLSFGSCHNLTEVLLRILNRATRA